MDKFTSAAALIRSRHPDVPVVGLRPHSAARSADWFVRNFPGRVLYAVKANNSRTMLDALYGAGIRDFDVASLAEIEQMSPYRDAKLYVMNPVLPRRTIASAYFDYGIRDFAVDSLEGLEKILFETGNAKDLSLYVRTKCDGEGAVLSLGNKFGIDVEDAGDLLLSARRASEKLGITFHVGSQAMEPSNFADALWDVDRLIMRSGVLPDVIDVGGGFPVSYPGMTPPPLRAYIDAIENTFEEMFVVETCALQCQPGRALVAEAGSVIVRVDARRGNALYINDGAYGTLFDAAHFGFVYPAQLVSDRIYDVANCEAFSFYGPTCDSFDAMKGPFILPADTQEGDYIEIGQLGAYGAVMATPFNGFGAYEEAILMDEPMMGMQSDTEEDGNVVRLLDGYEASGQ